MSQIRDKHLRDSLSLMRRNSLIFDAMTSRFFYFTTGIQIFILASKNKSFSQTAAALGITQPAVSKAIRRLEQDLGFELFHRYRPLRLTEPGERFLKALDVAGGIVNAALVNSQENGAAHPAIRIGMLESFSTLFGSRLVEELTPHSSHITFQLDSSVNLLHKLEHDELDIIIAMDLNHPNVDVRKTFIDEEACLVIFPKSYQENEDLHGWDRIRYCNLPFLSYVRDSSFNTILMQLMHEQGLSLDSTIEVNTNPLLFDFVANGKGWAITYPTCLLSSSQYLENIRPVSVPTPMPTRKLYVQYKRDELSTQVDMIVRLVRAYINKSQSVMAQMAKASQ